MKQSTFHLLLPRLYHSLLSVSHTVVLSLCLRPRYSCASIMHKAGRLRVESGSGGLIKPYFCWLHGTDWIGEAETISSFIIQFVPYLHARIGTNSTFSFIFSPHALIQHLLLFFFTSSYSISFYFFHMLLFNLSFYYFHMLLFNISFYFSTCSYSTLHSLNL